MLQRTPQTVADLVSQMREGWAPKFLFFWGHTAKGSGLGKECLSQWYPAPFSEAGRTYATAEHYMMAGKATLFRDEEMLARVLAAASPAAAKKFGRQVRGFEDRVWRAHRADLVARGSELKFRQHAELRAFLLATGDRVIVEASPRDAIWGIGMSESNPASKDPARWRGLNLLGFALMRARDALRADASAG